MQGWETTFADSAAEVMLKLAQPGLDLLVVDVATPENGGNQLVEQVRGKEWGRAIPIILMSAFDSPGERSKGFVAGANDFIAKPFNIVELLARVRAQLERASR